jgi:pentatricopeptide repeat protein
VAELWTSLAAYYTRLGHFEKARDIFEEALAAVKTIRDFSSVWDAYTHFSETILTADMEAQDDKEQELVCGAAEVLVVVVMLLRWDVIVWDCIFRSCGGSFRCQARVCVRVYMCTCVYTSCTCTCACVRVCGFMFAMLLAALRSSSHMTVPSVANSQSELSYCTPTLTTHTGRHPTTSWSLKCEWRASNDCWSGGRCC